MNRSWKNEYDLDRCNNTKSCNNAKIETIDKVHQLKKSTHAESSWEYKIALAKHFKSVNGCLAEKVA